MSYITNELSERIGRIDDNGYIYDNMDDRFAQITDSGYITAVAGWDTYGKIDEDGTIRDASMDVIGRIQADGYIYIHSKRVGRVSSMFIEKITPRAWNAGEATSYEGRRKTHKEENYDTSEVSDFWTSPFFLKLIVGLILGVIMMKEGVWGWDGLLGGPFCVFMFSFLAKIFG